MFTKTLHVAGLVSALAIGTVGPAYAVTAYMDGIINVGPKWSTITGPNGEKCGTGCTEIRYDYLTTKSAELKAGAWMDAHNTPDDVLMVYSLSTSGAIDARNARPNWQGTIVALGSPAKPENGNTVAQGGRPVPTVGGGKVEFVTAQGDSVAQPRTPGAKLSIHTSGYSGHNYQTETPISSTQYGSNVRDRVYSPTVPKPPVSATAVKFNLFKPSTWKPAAEQRKLERAEKAALKKATVAGRAAPANSEASPSRVVTAAERPATANSSEKSSDSGE
jgi:hypothetical protein